MDTASANATRLLPDAELREMRELVDAGEPGIALENFCTQLHEYDVKVSPELAAEVEAIAEAMGIKVSPPLSVSR